MDPKIRLRKDKRGYYYIVLQAANGEIQFVTESFETNPKSQSKHVAIRSVAAIKRNLFRAHLVIEE